MLFNFTHTGYHAFEVTIQTFDSLPVIGEDFTLVCTFQPQTRYRRVLWTKGNNVVVAYHSCLTDSACAGSNVPYPSKFSLLTDTSSESLIIHKLDRNDSDNYHCTVSSTNVESNAGSTSTSVQVTPLPPGIAFSIVNLHSKHQGKYINY